MCHILRLLCDELCVPSGFAAECSGAFFLRHVAVNLRFVFSRKTVPNSELAEVDAGADHQRVVGTAGLPSPLRVLRFAPRAQRFSR